MVPSVNILVAYKKSRYEQLVIDQHDESIKELIAQQDVSVARLLTSHDNHTRSLETILEELTRQNLSFDAVPRGQSTRPEDDYELVIIVGGDGTLLDLSHRILSTPVLAINSDPSASVGYFCAGTAADFATLLEKTLDKKLKSTQLGRFCATINHDTRTPPVLNEILICHANPAAVSSYFFRVDDYEEAQRSSGIWLSTPAGSTAAIRSAGGMVMPLGNNTIQFVVREPYMTSKSNFRQLKGVRPFGATIEVISKMQGGRIYVDGPHIEYPFQTGDRIRLDFNVPALEVFGMQAKRRAY